MIAAEKYYVQPAAAAPLAKPATGQLGRDHPADYVPDLGLVDAVNVALILQRPLLVTGDPGTGKTQLAFSVAWQLASRGKLNVGSPNVERFEAKSSSVARDLFYTFDALGRFQAGSGSGSLNNAAYITYNALGRALLRSLPHDQVSDCLSPDFEHGGPTRSVVLIDEIDKAPRDFPNDLLNEIDQMFFRIPEINNRRIGGPGQLLDDYRPLIFITSNSEKTLPDPFLRRCIYFNIPFPGKDALQRILLARLQGLQPGKLVEDTLSFFYHVQNSNRVRRKISPPELIQWLSYMLARKADPHVGLKEASQVALEGLSALVKNDKDQQSVPDELTNYFKQH
jgi:MoxR-like ATPase